MLCDRLEHRLKGSAQEKLLQVWLRSCWRAARVDVPHGVVCACVRVQSIFTGTLSNQIMCLGGCGSLRTQPEPYYCISMQVQHKKNLLESLEGMINVRAMCRGTAGEGSHGCSSLSACMPAGRGHQGLHVRDVREEDGLQQARVPGHDE